MLDDTEVEDMIMLDDPEMDRVRLLPMELPSTSSINGAGSTKGKISFVKRLALGCLILAGLGLLYVPAYHSVQESVLGLGETTPPGGPVGSTHFMASVVQLPGWGFNASRDVYSYINPENTTAIISPSDVCIPTPYLFIVVCSAVGNQNARLAIRNTWGNWSHQDSYNTSIRIVFLIGQSGNKSLDNSVVEENVIYRDIIQERFVDTYNNLTLKSIMMLKWATVNCNASTYLMKTDDDMFINIPLLIKTLRARHQSSNTLIGSLICNARPILDPKNKWYTPKYMYDQKTYPNYLSGTGYVMSLDVATKLYKTSLKTPLLHLEDVYITGICAKRSKLRPVNHAGFGYVPRKIESCTLREVITAHRVSPKNMYIIWDKLNEVDVTCKKNSSAPDSKKAVTRDADFTTTELPGATTPFSISYEKIIDGGTDLFDDTCH